MKRIVVGIDGSETGWLALAKAADLARATGASLQIAYVSPSILASLAGADYPIDAVDWVQVQALHAQELLADAVARVGDLVDLVETVSLIGLPADALAELASHADVSMTVVGHRGRNLPARLLVGSVADRLVQISPKPVLVVR